MTHADLTPTDLLAVAHAAANVPLQQVFASGPGHRARLSVTQGVGPWHHHPNTPETFIVLEGVLTLDFRDADPVTLERGHSLTVPVGLSHRSRATERTVSLSLEVAEPQVVLEEERS
ncbi:cupin domain-containing protein [Deinococcus marmoris]|uniref:cupin domain-containing protein n=1 Tax=Deinococcus marmoris TaxID=249408 RepID=UPI00049725DA|nr:cupin domain-containing protein [Deinococcus marmoris]